MSKVSDLHKKWSHAPEYQAAYEKLGPEFDLARVLLDKSVEKPDHDQSHWDQRFYHKLLNLLSEVAKTGRIIGLYIH